MKTIKQRSFKYFRATALSGCFRQSLTNVNFCGPHLIITGRRATTGCNRKTKPQATAKNCGYYDIEKEEISRDKYQRDKEKGITSCLEGHPLRKRDER